MAIFIAGKSVCPLCARVIFVDQEKISFPSFVANELDSLWIFSDGVFHADCFRCEPLAAKAQARCQEIRQMNGPGNRCCAICQCEVKDPEDYLALGHLTEDVDHAVYPYNYFQSHFSCLTKWSELLALYEALRSFNESGGWQGQALSVVLDRVAPYL
jgi:hypothetical protein